MTYIYSSEITDHAMPDREDDPSPEHFKVEVDALLTSFVDLWIAIAVLIIDVLLKRVCKQASPWRPQSVVKSLEPVSEEDLSWEAILEWEENLSEDQHNILVKVVADDPADASVAPPTMHEQKPV